MNKKNPITRILSLAVERKKASLFLVLLIAFATIFDIAAPFIIQKLIDRLMLFLKEGGEAPIAALVFSIIGILGFMTLSSVFRTTYDYNLFKEITTLEDNIKNKVLDKYYRLHAMFHQGCSSGQIIGRIERGAGAIYAILHDVIGSNLLPPFMVFIGVFAALIYKDPLIALAVFWPLPAYFISVKKITEKIYEIERKAHDEWEMVSKEMYDVAANILTVKKFSQEKAELKNQMRLLRKMRITQYEGERLWKIMENVRSFLFTMAEIGVILLGGLFVLKNKSTIGEFVLYISLSNWLYYPMAQFSSILPRLRRNTARVERLFILLDEPVFVQDKLGAVSLAEHKKSIEFRDVWFRYGEKRQWSLKNINVFIPAGSRVALVGKSGSGKTTFINMLLRSFDPEKGAILIDDNDLRDAKRESLLKQIAVVPQEVDLFSRTIFENIAYGRPDASREEVIQAAKTALAHDFIIQAEKGYDTLVGERGIKLSGGERQRVGIARAVLRDPKILILDEATSHLDTESEKLIAQATDALIKERTTFIIAHRLSTILGADIILVFSKGEIEAVGKHKELLEKSPTYQRLYSLQFRK